MSEQLIKTPIEGLKIRINKVVPDHRGYLCELAPRGSEDEMLSSGIKNIYLSTATQKKVSRGGHYHFKNIENFFTLYGTALWFFKDFRKNSKTKGKIFNVILGSQDFKGDLLSITIDQNKMAQVIVPPEVYHAYYPISQEPVLVLAIASEPYTKEDYVYPSSAELKEFDEVLRKSGIQSAI